MAERVVLVTGTSSGIGLAIAIGAANAGWRVVATMRDPSRSQALLAAANEAGVHVEVRPLDVVDQLSVQSCIDGVVAEFGRLDAVVNNAGAGHVGTIELETIDDVRAMMEVNFFGAISVSRAALPHLRSSGGRLVTVSSVGGVVGQPFNEAYCAAKFAVEGFMESLAPVAASLGVTVVVVEPGAVASAFVTNAKVDPAAMLNAAGPYKAAMQAYITRTRGQFNNAAQTPQQAAVVVVHALTAANPPFRIQTSEWATNFVGLKLADVDGSRVVGATTSWVTPSDAS